MAGSLAHTARWPSFIAEMMSSGLKLVAARATEKAAGNTEGGRRQAARQQSNGKQWFDVPVRWPSRAECEAEAHGA